MTCRRPLERYSSIFLLVFICQFCRYKKVLHTYLGWHKGTRWTNRCVIIKTILQHEEMCGSRMIGCTILKNGTYSPPPPISGTKTSRKLLILKLFPTPFKLMGSRSHRLMFAQFNMSFYHKTPGKWTAGTSIPGGFFCRWFSFSGPLQVPAVNVPCLQPAPHLPTLMIFLICSGGLNDSTTRCPGARVAGGFLLKKKRHLQKQMNYTWIFQKKSKICLPFFFGIGFLLEWISAQFFTHTDLEDPGMFKNMARIEPLSFGNVWTPSGISSFCCSTTPNLGGQGFRKRASKWLWWKKNPPIFI